MAKKDLKLKVNNDILEARLLYSNHDQNTPRKTTYTAIETNLLYITFWVLQNQKEKEVYKIKWSELEKQCKQKLNHQAVHKAAMKIFANPIVTRQGNDWEAFPLWKKFSYKEREATIEIIVNEEARKPLTEFQNKWGFLNLTTLLDIQSWYTKTIFLICTQWKNKGEYKIPLTELRERLGLQTKYKDFKVFNQKILQEAKTTINGLKNSDFHLEYNFDYRKDGLTITYVVFEFTLHKNLKVKALQEEKNNQLLDNTEEQRKINKRYEELIHTNWNPQQAEIIASKQTYFDEYKILKENALKQVTLNKLSLDKVNNWIVGAFQKQGILPKK